MTVPRARTLWDMARNHTTVRISDTGRARLAAIAAARSIDDVPVTQSGVLRELLSEALAARRRECGRNHRGPIKAGHCGHCGEET